MILVIDADLTAVVPTLPDPITVGSGFSRINPPEGKTISATDNLTSSPFVLFQTEPNRILDACDLVRIAEAGELGDDSRFTCQQFHLLA